MSNSHNWAQSYPLGLKDALRLLMAVVLRKAPAIVLGVRFQSTASRDSRLLKTRAEVTAAQVSIISLKDAAKKTQEREE